MSDGSLRGTEWAPASKYFVAPGCVTCSFNQYWAIANIGQYCQYWLGGGGGTQQSFIRGGSGPRSKPLPFCIPFLIEKVPLSYTFHRKLYPFSIPTERLLLNFSLQKPLKYLGELAVGCVCSRYFESPFL